MSELRVKAKKLSEEIIVTQLQRIKDAQFHERKLTPSQASYPIQVLKALALRDAIDEQKPIDLGGVTSEQIESALRKKVITRSA